MTLAQLKYVIEIANCSSLNEAAKNLYVSQPSLSSSLKELEDQIGITIFIRSNRGVALTSEGSDFLGFSYKHSPSLRTHRTYHSHYQTYFAGS